MASRLDDDGCTGDGARDGEWLGREVDGCCCLGVCSLLLLLLPPPPCKGLPLSDFTYFR